MAGSDPKTNRALGQASARADIDAEEDPLIELARIVSEDGGFSGPRTEKPRTTRGEPNGRDALADGLEAELLQELETSFAAREAPAPRAPVAANPPVAQRVGAAPIRQQPQPAAEGEADPDDLLRSIEEQLSQFERRQAGRFAPPSTFSPELPDPEPAQSFAAAQEPEEAPFGAPERVAEPREDWQNRRTSRIRPFAESAEALEEEAGAPPEPTFEEAPAVRSEYRFRGPANAEWDRASAAHEEQQARQDEGDRRTRETPPLFADDLRQPEPEAQVEPVLAAPKGTRVRADDGAAWSKAARPSDARRERLLATFPEFEEPAAPAERPAPDLTGIEEGLSLALEPIHPAASANATSNASAATDKWADGDALEDEETPRVAAAIPPGSSRRAAAARAAAQQRGRSRVGLFAALIIVVVVIGGVGAFYLRSSESTPSGPPPVIAAEPGAVRVDAAPDQNAAAGSETVGEAVYNRVAGAAPSTNEQVVENAEEPKEIARIVLPQSQADSGQTVVRPVGGEDTAATTDPTQPAPPAAAGAPTASSEAEIGPRRVPTFVVKADGSIVSTSEAGAPPPAPPTAQDPLANETQPIQPVPVPTVAIAPQAAAPANGASATSPPVPTPPAVVEPAPADLETRPTIDEPPAEVATATQSGTTAAPASNATVATAEPATPPVSASGGYLVQLSAQKSMDQAQAAYAKARQTYPALLGNLEPNIQQADLGTKGIYYRVRVGPWDTRDEALVVCEALKTAGGSCFVTQ